MEFDALSTHYLPVEEHAKRGGSEWDAMIEGRWGELGWDDPEVFRSRVQCTIDRIIEQHPGQRVVAVCHGGVINVTLAAVLGIDRLLWFAPGYTSLNRVIASRNGLRGVISINELAHLEASREAAIPFL